MLFLLFAEKFSQVLTMVDVVDRQSAAGKERVREEHAVENQTKPRALSWRTEYEIHCRSVLFIDRTNFWRGKECSLMSKHPF